MGTDGLFHALTGSPKHSLIIKLRLKDFVSILLTEKKKHNLPSHLIVIQMASNHAMWRSVF